MSAAAAAALGRVAPLPDWCLTGQKDWAPILLGWFAVEDHLPRAARRLWLFVFQQTDGNPSIGQKRRPKYFEGTQRAIQRAIGCGKNGIGPAREMLQELGILTAEPVNGYTWRYSVNVERIRELKVPLLQTLAKRFFPKWKKEDDGCGEIGAPEARQLVTEPAEKEPAEPARLSLVPPPDRIALIDDDKEAQPSSCPLANQCPMRKGRTDDEIGSPTPDRINPSLTVSSRSCVRMSSRANGWRRSMPR